MYIDSSKLLNALSRASGLASKIVKDPKALKVLNIAMQGNDALLDDDFKDLVMYAYVNKVLLLLLLKEPKHKLIRNLRLRLLRQRDNFLMHLRHVVEILDICRVDYVIFKTLRPVPDAPVDIDVLVESKDDAYHVISCLKRKFNVEIWDEDRYSIGIRIPEFNEYVDFYVKPHVANFVYLDPEALIRNRAYLSIKEPGVEMLVPIPRPELEFCSILAHSFIKEGLVTLNDVISLITYELLSNRNELTRWLTKLSLSVTYREFTNALRKIFPVRIGYEVRFKVLASLLMKRYTASTLPYSVLSMSRRLSRAMEQRKKITYIRGLGR